MVLQLYYGPWDIFSTANMADSQAFSFAEGAAGRGRMSDALNVIGRTLSVKDIRVSNWIRRIQREHPLRHQSYTGNLY